VRRIVDAWRAFWFTPASLVDLGVARVIVAGIFLLLDPRTRYLRVAFIPPPLWKPLPVVAALGLPQPGLAALQWMGSVTTGLLVASALGILARVALVALLPLVLLQEAWLNSAGKITHGTIPLVWALALLALSPCDRRFTVGEAWRRVRGRGASAAAESAHARWPLLLVFAEIASFYCAAGVTKLRTSGFAWADGWTLQYLLLMAGTPAGLWIAGSRSLCALLSSLVLTFELTAPLGLVSRLRPFVLAGGAAFHLGTTLLLHISFWPVVALYLVFVPWTRLATAARISFRRAR
jgi:hypothetical protein